MEEAQKARSLVFVYGTLKQGFPNHHLLAAHLAAGDVTFAGACATAAPTSLVVGPFDVPFLLLPPHPPASGRRVAGELYAASPRAVAALDVFEGTHLGVYERRPLAVVLAGGAGGGGEEKVVEAEAYFAHRSYVEAMWRRCGGEAAELAEYTMEDAAKYVPPSARPGVAGLIDAIKSFLAPPPPPPE